MRNKDFFVFLHHNKTNITKKRMKKFLLFCGLFLMSMVAMADGTEPEKIDVKELTKITFEGDNVILHFKDGSKADLEKDLETIVIDFSSVTAIETLRQVEPMKNMSVYNLQGQCVGQGVEGLKKGLYIVNGKKVIIK